MNPDEHLEPAKRILDAAGALTVVGTIWGEMPNIAAAFAVAWYLVRFVEWGAQKFRAWRGR